MKTNFKKRVYSVLLMIAVIFSALYMPQNAKIIMAASPTVESAISWAIAIANDNSHGYSQSNRWGPDYDCSSFVISAFRNAGVNVGSASYTGNMKSQFTQHGFQWIPWSQIGGTSNLQRGDILLNEAQHTEIYLGNNKNVGAHSSKGHPETGDQTGQEISVSGYYNHPWNGVLRYVAAASTCNCSTDYAGDYYVSTNSLPLTMRSGHGTNYGVVTSIPKGSTVHVSRADGNWAHVEWNGHSGYCSMQYLTRVSAKSYRLHVWVSDTKMGEVPSNYEVGNRYYICYEVIDESTGKRAGETGNITYSAKETVRNSKGTVYEYTYQNSDNNWISFVCSEEDTYTGTVTISGDIGISCSVSLDAKYTTKPEMKTWLWDTSEDDEIESTYVGENVNISYLIRDKYSKKNLNEVTNKWTQGDGYTVTMKVYDPDGSEIKSNSYKNKDHTKMSFTPSKSGKYAVKIEVSGKMQATFNKQLTVNKKVISTPTAVPTATPTATPTVTPTISPEPSQMGTEAELENGDWKKIAKSTLSKLKTFVMGEDEDEFTDEIKVGKISLKYIKHLKGRKILIKWNKKADVDGYQVEYSTNRKFINSKSVKMKKATAVVKKLNNKKTYYVRVRSYKKNNGKNVYGKWSNVRKITSRR